MEMTKYYVDAGGKYLGAFEGAEPPEGSIEVSHPPAHMNVRYVYDSTQATPADRHYFVINGTRHSKIPRDLLTEIPESSQPDDYSDETYYRTEQDDAPYIVYTKKSAEQLMRLQDDKDRLKAEQHLATTDYLFSIDRHAMLSKNEPEREAELVASREAAREVIRAHKLKYPPQI